MSERSEPADRVCGEVVTDPEANAATIIFDGTASGRSLVDYPISAANGDLIAVITFTATGRLAKLQLLDAASQMPAS